MFYKHRFLTGFLATNLLGLFSSALFSKFGDYSQEEKAILNNNNVSASQQV